VEEAGGELEDVLAAAAGDRLVSYSRELRPSTEAEKAGIAEIFEMAGPYRPFELRPGAVPGCPECAHHNNHVFSSWFYGVAWDLTFVVMWPSESLAWVGCLTLRQRCQPNREESSEHTDCEAAGGPSGIAESAGAGSWSVVCLHEEQHHRA
jgi:hypothetical protein